MLTPEQLQIRRGGIGGSEAAAVLGLNPWRTKFDVWYEKCFGSTVESETPHIYRGNFLEPAIMKWFETQYKVSVSPCDTIIHADYPIIRATPDGIIHTRGSQEKQVIEVKCPSWRTTSHWGPVNTAEIPDYYIPQVMWEMAVTGLHETIVVGFFNDELNVYRVPWDEELFHLMRCEIESFWRENVIPGVSPEVDHSESAAKWLAERYPDRRPEALESNEAIDALALKYRHMQSKEKELDTAKSKLKNQIIAAMGEYKKVKGAWGSFNYSQSKPRKVTAWKSLCEDLKATDEQIAKFTGEKSYAPVLRPYFRDDDHG